MIVCAIGFTNIRVKSHTSAPSITTESILRIQESPCCSPINGFPDIFNVDSAEVVIVPIPDIVFCTTVLLVLPDTQSLFV